MKKTYRIHPAIGIARLGNSPREFYLGPEKTGGLPVECDGRGNPLIVDGADVPVRRYKDASGAIKRQAARFKIFAHGDDGSAAEASIGGGGEITAVRWTVHLANKKAIWYHFEELKGDLTFGPENSYERQHVPRRNPTLLGTDRQRAIIDLGPRSVATPGARAEFSAYNIPPDYPSGGMPTGAQQDAGIASLGEILMDDASRLLVLGGFGNSGGQATIASYAGAEGWFDDVSDGYVLATLTLADGTTLDLAPAWVVIASPKYAPELVNIITLDDCLYDTAVRGQNYHPGLYDAQRFPHTYASGGDYNPFAGFNPDFCPSYERDIRPIIVRPQAYRWVANVPSMIDFTRPPFDPSDPGDTNRANREEFFRYYRVPVPPGQQRFLTIANGPTQLFSADGLPLMPLNSGDNSVQNSHLTYKFLTLTPTQYFFMKQWALGKFTPGEAPPDDRAGVVPLDREVVGNCVGGPFSPGIELPWLMRNPAIYAEPYRLRAAHWTGNAAALASYYAAHGLSTTTDPDDGSGAEPGDLTKRMAAPWQADFFDCTFQTPNITIPDVNQTADDQDIQVPPAYLVYWWPPQAPVEVIAGALDPGDQVLDGFASFPPTVTANSSAVYQVASGYQIVAAGQPVAYQRGVSSFTQMVAAWAELGFVLNQGTARYPYFVERERNARIMAQGVALGKK